MSAVMQERTAVEYGKRSHGGIEIHFLQTNTMQRRTCVATLENVLKPVIATIYNFSICESKYEVMLGMVFVTSPRNFIVSNPPVVFFFHVMDS